MNYRIEEFSIEYSDYKNLEEYYRKKLMQSQIKRIEIECDDIPETNFEECKQKEIVLKISHRYSDLSTKFLLENLISMEKYLENSMAICYIDFELEYILPITQFNEDFLANIMLLFKQNDIRKIKVKEFENNKSHLSLEIFSKIYRTDDRKNFDHSLNLSSKI